jgi:hypothetical protein
MKMAISGLAAIAFAGMAHAQAPGGDGKPINPFSDCGIGAALFPDTAWAAVISNVTWDVGTTAVTSAVASPNTCNGGRTETASFINSTFASLEVDTAVGEGKYLEALADVMTCDAAVRPQLFSQVRMGLADAMTTPEYAEMETVKKAEIYFNIADNLARKDFEGACYKS